MCAWSTEDGSWYPDSTSSATRKLTAIDVSMLTSQPFGEMSPQQYNRLPHKSFTDNLGPQRRYMFALCLFVILDSLVTEKFWSKKDKSVTPECQISSNLTGWYSDWTFSATLSTGCLIDLISRKLYQRWHCLCWNVFGNCTSSLNNFSPFGPLIRPACLVPQGFTLVLLE